MRTVLFVTLLLLSGCCSKTTLVLLPDDTGQVGQVSMRTEGGEVLIDQAYGSTSVSSSKDSPAPATRLSPEYIQEQYGPLLAAQPPVPASFTLYFQSGSTDLTMDSTGRLADVIAAVKQDAPVEVDIIGHSDKVGDEEYNHRLSLGRAEAVKRLLLAEAPWISAVFVRSHGENDPLVPTADNVAEPKNRRVEVLVR